MTTLRLATKINNWRLQWNKSLIRPCYDANGKLVSTQVMHHFPLLRDIGLTKPNVLSFITYKLCQGTTRMFIPYQFSELDKECAFVPSSQSVALLQPAHQALVNWLARQNMDVDLQSHEELYCINHHEKDVKKRQFKPFWVSNLFVAINDKTSLDESVFDSNDH